MQLHGHDVAVCCLFRAGTLAPELQAAGIDVISAGKRNGPDLRAVWRVRRALVETLLYGNRLELIKSLDETLLGLRPRPSTAVAA